MTRTRNVRTGFTLVELLAVMGIIIVLAGIAASVVPAAVSQDRTTDGAALTRQYLMIAKNRAARDGQPRGLRLIVTADSTVPTKNPLWVTEVQEIEAPLVLVVNGNQTTTFDVAKPTVTGFASPLVRVLYTVDNTGVITNRQLFIQNLTLDQISQIQPGGMIGVPEFNGYWARILSVSGASAGPTTFTVSITVDVPPDEYMGASTEAVSYRFGIYSLPLPLLGAATQPLPKNICIDLSLATGPVGGPTYPYAEAPSRPEGLSAAQPYDILFAPNGQVINGIGRPNAQGQMFLWVRDYTKAANPLIVTGQAAGLNVYDMTVFRTAGEQQILSLKTKSGAMGVFPVTWPQDTGGPTGQYVGGQDPYSFARVGATGP